MGNGALGEPSSRRPVLVHLGVILILPPVLLTHRPPIRHHGRSGREQAGPWWSSARSTPPSSRRGRRAFTTRGAAPTPRSREQGMRCRRRVRLGEEGARRGPSGGGQPVPGRRGARAPQARERAAAQGERDPFKSERLLREQGSARKAKFELVAVFSARCAVTALCSALGVTRPRATVPTESARYRGADDFWNRLAEGSRL